MGPALWITHKGKPERLQRRPIFSGYCHLVNYALRLFPDFSLIVRGFLVCRYTALNRPVWAQVESLVC